MRAEDLVGCLGVECPVEPGGELAQVGAGRDELQLGLGELEAARLDDLDQVFDRAIGQLSVMVKPSRVV